MIGLLPVVDSTPLWTTPGSRTHPRHTESRIVRPGGPRVADRSTSRRLDVTGIVPESPVVEGFKRRGEQIANVSRLKLKVLKINVTVFRDFVCLFLISFFSRDQGDYSRCVRLG